MAACAVNRGVVLSLLAVIAGLGVAGSAFHIPHPANRSGLDLASFLRTNGAFSRDDIQRLERGEAVSNGLAADDATVALAAAVQVDVPPEFLLERFRQIEQFKKAPEVQQIWRFGSSPGVEDLAGLTLDAEELEDARRCKVGHCVFKLDTAGIERLRATGDDAAAMQAFRAHLAEYSAAYLRSGNSALMEYRDRSRPLAMSSELLRILADSPYLLRHWPDLHTAVAAFSGTLPEGLDDFLYWSKEKVASRPVVSLTHVIVRPPRDGITAIATKQLYASHYTTGSLGLTLLQDKGRPDAPRTLVAYLNRTRVDVFAGLLGGVKRPMVRSRARSGAERMMRTLKVKLEEAYQGKK